MEALFLNDWECGEMTCLASDFDIDLKELDGAEILLASYGTGSYSGDAFVLFRRGGKLFEVNGSHCSCYGLEGQWDPEEASVAEIEHRLENGTLGKDAWCINEFASELRVVLQRLKGGE